MESLGRCEDASAARRRREHGAVLPDEEWLSPLEFDGNPLFVAVGVDGARTQRGAVIGNVVMFAAWLLVAAIIGVARSRIERLGLDTALQKVHFPGVAAIVVLVWWPATAQAAGVLVM